ncbi:hypothetical protein [Moraxella lacunata]|uniref:hypothetical protein n=1 Tax=Moraxella lacunata TaxID=477 RepID=UPI003EE1DB6B
MSDCFAIRLPTLSVLYISLKTILILWRLCRQISSKLPSCISLLSIIIRLFF